VIFPRIWHTQARSDFALGIKQRRFDFGAAEVDAEPHLQILKGFLTLRARLLPLRGVVKASKV
jgi:hypothetical protein